MAILDYMMNNMVALFAGVAVTISCVAFYAFATVTNREAAFKRRMAIVRDDRASLRSTHLGSDAGRATAKDVQAQKIEAALTKLQMSKQIEDKSLRMRLVRAGYRKRRHQVNFVVLQFLLAPAAALFAYVAYQVVMKPEEPSLLVDLGVVLGGAMFGFLMPGMQLDGLAAERQKKIRRAYPDVLDLLTICVESGMSIEASFNRVSDEIGDEAEEMAQELRITTAELSYLGDRKQALENLAERTNLPEVRAIVAALAQAERYGTPVGQALRVLAQESRFERMSRAEAKAAALPAKLTVPMMVFFLPVLFIVILGPAIIQVLE